MTLTKNRILNIMLVLLIGFMCIIPTAIVKAEEGEINTDTAETIEMLNRNDGHNNNHQGGNGNSNPTVGTDPSNLGNMTPDYINQTIHADGDLNNLGDRIINKIYEVANILQRMTFPIALIVFFVGAGYTVWGALSRRATVIPGVITLIATVVCYALCAYAPQIIVWASSWLIAG